MKYKVVISQDAKDSITDTIRFLANVNKISAKKELDVILNEMRSLEEFPLRHEVVEGLKILNKDTRKFVISKGKYIILYNVSDQQVFVNKFLDTRKENKIINILLG